MAHLVVSGLPGSGKSTLARALARELQLPWLAMDPVKELLWDVLGGGDVERSRQLGRAANEVVMSIVAESPPAVLDSFWRHEWAVDRLGALAGDVVEVFCGCPPDLARRRFGERRRHAAHLDAERVGDADLWATHRNRPLFDHAVVVDGRQPVAVEPLAAEVRAHPRWEEPPARRGAVLVVLAGLPGTGKSTIAAAVSRAIGAPVLGRDVVGAALGRAGAVPPGDPGGVAFHVMARVAFELLGAGGAVILDTVSPFTADRDRWRALGDHHRAPVVVIECVCPDEAVHRSRLQGRRRGIEGWYEVTWEAVEEARRRYEPWVEERLVLDARQPRSENIQRALRYVEAS